MRFGHLQPINNWFGWLLFHAGVLLVIVALWFVYYNVLTTAAVVIGLYDGTVVQTNLTGWLPALTITNGGLLGKGFGVAVGLLIFVLQFMYWASQDDFLGNFAVAAKWIGKALLVTDFCASMFFLMGGVLILDVAARLWGWPLFFRFIGSVGISLGMLSIGCELWLAVGIEVIRTQWKVALEGYLDFFAQVREIMQNLPDPRQPAGQPQAIRPGGMNSRVDRLLEDEHDFRPSAQMPQSPYAPPGQTVAQRHGYHNNNQGGGKKQFQKGQGHNSGPSDNLVR